MCLFTCLVTIYSCKSNEEKAKDIVDGFLKQASDDNLKRKDMDYASISAAYKQLFDSSNFYVVQNYNLSIIEKTDTSITIKSIGKTHNALGVPIDFVQEFRLKKINDTWKIIDSHHFLEDKLNLEVVGADWDSYWDKTKVDIMNHIKKNVKLEVINPGVLDEYTESKEGKIRIINDSDFDITKFKLQIEHFDQSGKSVNTDIKYIPSVVRKKAYRDYSWYSIDCAMCSQQVFKILFAKEEK
jgi:hypothetical protein